MLNRLAAYCSIRTDRIDALGENRAHGTFKATSLKSSPKLGTAPTVSDGGTAGREPSASVATQRTHTKPCRLYGKLILHEEFLSFGRWTPSPQSQARSAADVLLQSIDLAVEVERLGMDGAYFRVHHFAQQLVSPFPLLAAVGAKTRKIEIGTAVIDMRYENPHYMAEDAGAADLIAGGRLQLGISRGSREQVIDGWRYFGYRPLESEDDAEMGRRHAEELLELLRGKGFAKPHPRPMFPNPPGLLRLEPYSEGLHDRIWWGSASNATAAWAAKLGMNMQTSTLKFDETGEPLHVQQSAQNSRLSRRLEGSRTQAHSAYFR